MARAILTLGRTQTHRQTPSQVGYVGVVNKQMKTIRDNLSKVIKAINTSSPQALEYALTPMFNTSQRLVPKKTLELKRSGFLEARRTAYGATVAIGYGRGGKPIYAPIVHERTELHHANGTQAKYLQEAVQRHIRNVPRRYAEFVRDQLGLN